MTPFVPLCVSSRVPPCAIQDCFPTPSFLALVKVEEEWVNSGTRRNTTLRDDWGRVRIAIPVGSLVPYSNAFLDACHAVRAN